MTPQDALTYLPIYHIALFSLTLLCIAVMVQGVLAGILGLANSPEEPGKPLQGDHPDFSFRTLRTYGNSVENLPAFGLTLIVAVIIGASPIWVNWLAASHVLIRLVYWAVYYSGKGAVGGGLRTIVYVIGLFTNLLLALVTLLALVV